MAACRKTGWLPGRRAGTRTRVLLAVLCAALATAGLARGEDREHFGKIMQAMPPNGPFWKYGNVEMRRKSRKAGMEPVIFTHWSHRSLYTCRVCHEQLGFSMRAGDTGITRAEYLSGKYCGACHDGVIAFTVRDGAACARCHIKDTRHMEERFDSLAAQLPLAGFGNGIDWAEALAK